VIGTPFSDGHLDAQFAGNGVFFLKRQSLNSAGDTVSVEVSFLRENIMFGADIGTRLEESRCFRLQKAKTFSNPATYISRYR
jgi:hypothetical protein